MRIHRQTLIAFFLALLGTVLPGGGRARADEALTASPHSDFITDELRKNRLAEDHVAVHRTAVPAPQTGRNVRPDRDGPGDFACAADAELVFLGLAELRPDFLPPADAVAPAPPALALPPSRSPPSR